MSKKPGEISKIADGGSTTPLPKVEPGDQSSSSRFETSSQGIELVFGLVGPTGVDLGKVFDSLRRQLKSVDYDAISVRLSDLISPYLHGEARKFGSEYQRIRTLMNDGTQLREDTGQIDIVGRLGVASISSLRRQSTGSQYEPKERTAYVVSSFKRPEEVELFRTTYGKAFTLISVYAPRQARIQDLSRRLRSTAPDDGPSPEQLAVELITTDFEEEGRKYGQRVGKTFPLADYFIVADSKDGLDSHLLRMVRLTFGDPYISPTKDEQGMYFAQAAALRSLDLSRQVGAAIIDDDGEIISTGCNEVPKFGGGLYWADDKRPARDFEIGHDSNGLIKSEILEDLIGRFRVRGWLPKEIALEPDKRIADDALFKKGADFLKSSLLFDVIEFGRAVHAEAASITQAARRGVSTQNSRLFCTTFPCHICARHIISAGIAEVVFIEPYEKSRTHELYSDSVSVEPQEKSNKRVNFNAFVGVAPRRYVDCFQLIGDRKDAQGRVLDSDSYADKPKIKRMVAAYLFIEDLVIHDTIRPKRKEQS